jgi:hypothetical protein
VSRAGHRRARGDRVVDRVQAARAADRAVGVALLLVVGEPHDEVVQMRQQFLRRRVQVGEGAHGGTQTAHGCCGVEAVPAYVADDEGDTGRGQRDDVEPTAARAGERPARHIDAGGLRGRHLEHRAGQQAALQTLRRAAFAGVAPRVVDGEGRAGADVLPDGRVTRVERRLLRRPPQRHRAEDMAAGLQRHDHVRGRTRRQHQPAAFRVVGDPRPQLVDVGHDDGRTAAQPVALVPLDPDDGAQRIQLVRPVLSVLGDGGDAAQRRAGGERAGLLTDQHGFRDVHAGEVREGGDEQVGQYLCVAADIQGAAQRGRRRADERRAPPGPFLLGHVREGDGDAADDAVPACHAQGGERDGPFAFRGLRQPGRRDEVDQRFAGGDDVAQLRLDGQGVLRHEHLVEPPARRIGRWPGVVRQRVAPDHPQLAVVDGEADAGLREQGPEQRVVLVPPVGHGRRQQPHQEPRRQRALHGKQVELREAGAVGAL